MALALITAAIDNIKIGKEIMAGINLIEMRDRPTPAPGNLARDLEVVAVTTSTIGTGPIRGTAAPKEEIPAHLTGAIPGTITLKVEFQIMIRDLQGRPILGREILRMTAGSVAPMSAETTKEPLITGIHPLVETRVIPLAVIPALI